MTTRPLGPPAREAEISKATLTDIARGAGELAALIERGQAAQPLAALAQGLAAPTPEPLCLTLLSTTREARDSALRWLVGSHHHLVHVDAIEALDLVEIRLQQQGFAIGADATGRRDYATAEEFSAALQAALPVFTDAGGAAQPLVLVVAASRPVPDLRITVLPAPERVIGLHALPARLAARPSLLVVAAPAVPAFGEPERAAFALLAPLACAAWPVVVGAAGPAERVARTWPLGGVALLPASSLDAAQPCELPDFLTQGPVQPVAAALHRVTRARHASSLVEMLGERHESDLAQLRSRLKREQRLEKSAEAAGSDAPLRAELDQAKQRAGEDFTSLAQAIRETQRRALLRPGVVGQLLAELSASVQPRDLQREDSGKVVRLALDRNFVDQTRQRFAKGARRLLDEHCVVVRDAFELLRRRTEGVLQASGARTLSVPLDTPDPGALWESLRDVVQLDLKYRGEVPRRGLLQRLGAGRQVVFGVLMVSSLVGGFLGFNVRQAAFAGVFMLALFAGAVAWTFHSWKRQDEQAIGHEIEKVREGVLAELERLATEVARDMQTRLLEFVDQAKRDFLARLDAATREWQSGAAAQIEIDRRETRSRIKLIEQRDKELQALGLQLGKLRTQTAQVGADAQAALRDATARPAGTGA